MIIYAQINYDLKTIVAIKLFGDKYIHSRDATL